MRRISLALLGSVSAGTLAAQVLPLTVPKGKVRIDILGQFQSWDQRWNDGTKEEAAADFNRSIMDRRFIPDLGSAEDHVRNITGQTALALSLGRSTSSYLVNRGTTGFGGAYGINRWLTVHGMVPIVAVKVEPRFLTDTTGSNAGINPASALAANGAARAQTVGFLGQLAAALNALQAKITAGYPDPATQVLAEQTLARGLALQTELAALLDGPASYFAPSQASAAGQAVLQVISDLQSVLSGNLQVTGFTALPALPGSPFGLDAFDSYLTSKDGPIGARSLTEIPALSFLGDIEVGASVALIDNFPTARIGAGFRAVADATIRLRTAKLDSPDRFMDVGTGDRQPDVDLSLVADYVRGRLGARMSAEYNLQLAGNQNRRVSRYDQPIAALTTVAGVRRDPGDVIHLSAQPFLRLATYISLFGSADYYLHQRDKFTYAPGQPALDGVDIDVLGDGTKSKWLMLAGGLSFSHAGLSKRGERKLPMDASLRYERIVQSGLGIFPDTHTLRIDLRFYGRLFGK